jgi:SSS family solute:Na+ symporter
MTHFTLNLPQHLAIVGQAAAPTGGFQLIDWLVVVGYGLLLVGIGYAYSRRQKSSEEYFVGSRSVAPFLAGISLYATMFSTLSYIGFPGEVIQNGPVLICFNLAAFPLIYFAVGYGVIPLLMKLPVTSAYELLEVRLGRSVRLLGSSIFVLTRLVWMAVMLYTTSLVLATVMGWDRESIMWISIAAGVITTFYTLTGGLRAVLVSDAVQFFVLLAGALCTLIYITVRMGGVGAWWPTHWVQHWAPQPIFSLDPQVRVTVVGTFIGALIWWVCTAASDQMAIQRYLSTRDVASGRRAFLHNVIGGIVVSGTLILVGLALLGFYQKNGALFPSNLSLRTQGDTLFPYFVSHFLPAGLPGLVMAGLLAAAMSSLSSGINSSITVISKDFIDTLAPGIQRTERSRITIGRILAAIIGALAIGGSQLAVMIPGNLIEVVGKSINLLLCPIFGLFYLALFVPFATPFGAYLGALYSLTAAALIAYWDLITGGPPISFQWIPVVALLTTVICSTGFSLLPTRTCSRTRLAVYAVLSVLPLVALLLWVGS